MRIEQHKNWDRIGGIVCLVLLVLQLAVFLMSWIVSTINPDLPVRSLLGGEGIRWFFGHFLTIVGDYGAAWLILILIACGAVAASRILPTIRSWIKKEPLSYRQKYALRCSFIALLLFIAVIIVLTCTKEAVLVSASGTLFPSSFSKAIVPVVAFILTALAVLFGSLSAQFRHIGEVFHALYVGPQRGAALFVVYVFACQFFASLAWAFHFN